jgi:hypothetical protein
MTMQIPIPECFDTFEDALKAAVMAMGGFKAVAGRMRPADFENKPEQGADWLRKCLSGDRRERLDPTQVLWILREARRVGFHSAMDYACGDTGYKATPVDNEEQIKDLSQAIASGMEQLQAAVQQLARLQTRGGE